MNLIVAADNNWGIGKDNSLLVHIPEDMKFFREMTTEKVVVMGRKTLESFPFRRPLKNRTNIVLTSDTNYKVDGAIVVHSVEQLLALLKNYNSEDVFIIGGASIYKQMLNYCSTAYVTKIKETYEADTYFPNLEELDNWDLQKCSEEKEYDGIKYQFVKYINRNFVGLI